MKVIRVCLILLLMPVGESAAQREIPPPPGVSGKPRATGSTRDASQPVPRHEAEPEIRYLTRLILSESRLWTSTEGKQIEGRLVAFDNPPAGTPAGATPPVASEAPEKPTVIRDGGIRIQLANRKVIAIPLARLSGRDREFALQIHKRHHGETPPR